ncbi:MAG: pirin family protein [Bacteroidia bacterium]|nr:pirin family protein [Bacteroidia bacterium]
MKTISSIIKAEKIDMGGVKIDQALPVKTIQNIDPFLLVHHWYNSFPGGQLQKDVGVGPHPHRGFSPVTVIYKGAVHHRDSLGHDSIVRAGGVQWMSAGKGVTHSERPAANIASEGGEFEIIQFWVNTPSQFKMDKAIYIPLQNRDIPGKYFEGQQSQYSVICGDFMGLEGPVKAKQDLLILNIDLKPDETVEIEVPEYMNCCIYSLDGQIELNGTSVNDNKSLVHFNNEGTVIKLTASKISRLLLLAGQPINEEVVSYGPFVMNSTTEILTAIKDAQMGKMGILIEEF